MSLETVGQRCLSEREPELGLGVVAAVDPAAKRIAVNFPATGERRLYALGTPVLKRVQFRAGETVTARDGSGFTIERVEESGGVLVYVGAGRRVREDEISDAMQANSPAERLLAGQTDASEVFDLRIRALQLRAKLRESSVRGFLGGRVDLIPHQFYILNEVASRQIPRVLLADEVGLGKTIEACLVLQRLLVVGKVRRALVLVPETLVHQWFVELLRRFNLWFGIYDEARCSALEQSDPGANPFLASQLVLGSVSFLAQDERRGAQAVEAGWDMVVVDEAHHLAWTPEHASAEYRLVERLAQRSAGLLLLTATPMQLGIEGHFARLRLLDPARYKNLEAFQAEAAGFGTVAEIAEKIVEKKPLRPKEREKLAKIFDKDPEGLAQRLAAFDAGRAGAREALLRTLLDQHGTGRVMFRNTRAAMSGFPVRRFCPAAIEDYNVTLHARIARELQAEEAGAEAEIRYSFKDDPRIDWLVELMRKHRPAKVLLICKFQRKVAAIAAAIQEKTSVKVGLFHEGLPLVQRDRNAAWFAEPEGAQLLICSEIGSEGRNFQFAHHLVLFDLPLNPGLLEQRIGRLDRIGQTETIRVHVPYIVGSADECVVEWYHRGLDAFETPLHGGNEYLEAFRGRLLELAQRHGRGGREGAREELETFVGETSEFRRVLNAKLQKGRDRLLELNSFDRGEAERVIARVREADGDTSLRGNLIALLDHFGVRVREHEEGDVFLDPSHAFIEAFPSLPAEGMLTTFDRQRAIVREDIRFLSADHSLVQDTLDLLIDSPAGTTAFVTMPAERPGLLLEALFVLEAVAESRWQVDQFLAPQPVRVLVDLRGGDVTDEHPSADVMGLASEAEIHRFLEQPGFDASRVKAMAEAAAAAGETRAQPLRASALERAKAALETELERLVQLQRVNDHVRPEEVALAREQLERTRAAIETARLRLDAVRLILAAPTAGVGTSRRSGRV